MNKLIDLKKGRSFMSRCLLFYCVFFLPSCFFVFLCYFKAKNSFLNLYLFTYKCFVDLGLESNLETSKKPAKLVKGTAVKRSSVDNNDSSASLPDKKSKPEPKPQKKSKVFIINTVFTYS